MPRSALAVPVAMQRTMNCLTLRLFFLFNVAPKLFNIDVVYIAPKLFNIDVVCVYISSEVFKGVFIQIMLLYSLKQCERLSHDLFLLLFLIL